MVILVPTQALLGIAVIVGEPQEIVTVWLVQAVSSQAPFLAVK